MSSRFMGIVHKRKISTKFNTELVFYEHMSVDHAIAPSRKVAIVGASTYSRYLQVAAVHDDNGEIAGEFKCKKFGEKRMLTLSFEHDSDSLVDEPIAVSQDKIYLES